MIGWIVSAFLAVLALAAAVVAWRQAARAVRLEAAHEELGERLRQQTEEIERIESSRGELVTNLSHDLRTPIANLRGYLETLDLKGEQLTADERQQYLGVALRQAERLSRLVRELFEVTRLDEDRLRPKIESFSLPELIYDNVQRIRLEAEERGVETAVEVAVEHPFVKADIRLIERVLENLLNNALRFTPSGGRVTVAVRENDERLEVAVIDTGRGIDEEDLPRIFERYYQAPRRGGPPRPAAGGAGLGLAIAKRILELHGSKIEVVSEPGSGSTFSFSLKRAPEGHTTGSIPSLEWPTANAAEP